MATTAIAKTVHSQGAPRGRRALATLVCLSSVALTGCGQRLADVTGSVTIDGQPLRAGQGVRATVVFQPVGGGAPAIGLVDEQGAYRLSTGSQSGVKPGEYLATCTATQIIPPKDGNGTPTGRRLTDIKYASATTSGFRFSVQPGGNEFDLKLESPKTGRLGAR